MAKTDTSERWFEARVVRGLTGVPQPEYSHELASTDFAATHNGYIQGKPIDYNRDVALDVAQLLAFLQATQPMAVDTLELSADGIKRTQFLHRLQGEITKRGVVDVLPNDRWNANRYITINCLMLALFDIHSHDANRQTQPAGLNKIKQVEFRKLPFGDNLLKREILLVDTP